jgi:hypothetical protein
MRRILLIALLSMTGAALLASTAAAKPKHKPKPLTYKVGTYKAQVPGEAPFSIVLKRASCGGKLQFCVSLPISPEVQCLGPVLEEVPVASFVALIPLPSSGKVTQQGPITGSPTVPGETTIPTGQSGFSVTFTKKGTATGLLEVSLAVSIQGTPTPCAGKKPFTAKLA